MKNSILELAKSRKWGHVCIFCNQITEINTCEQDQVCTKKDTEIREERANFSELNSRQGR